MRRIEWRYTTVVQQQQIQPTLQGAGYGKVRLVVDI